MGSMALLVKVEVVFLMQLCTESSAQVTRMRPVRGAATTPGPTSEAAAGAFLPDLL